MSGPDLARLADDARAGGTLAVDTEFMTEGRYHPLLCLVQVAVRDAARPEGVRVALVDPLDPAGAPDPAPLAAVLGDPAVEVVVHAGRQDVAILRRVWGAGPTTVFDTQVAAGFAGLGAQTGYVNLLADVLGVRLPKSAGFTRWDVRPLTAEQLAYARGDVAYLLQLAGALRERLRASGRLEWARAECATVEAASDLRVPEEAWRRLPRLNQLSARARAVARELAAWRERTAAREDRPVSSTLQDVVLVEIARRQPRDTEALRQIRGLHPQTLRRRGAGLLEAVRAGMAAPPLPREPEEWLAPDPDDGPVIALAEALVRSRALAADLAYEILATRADLTRVVAAARRGQPEPDVRTIRGWRRDVVGAELLELLAGRRSVAVGEAGRLQVTPRG